MKAVVAAFNQEKALVGAFSVITNLQMDLFEALKPTPPVMNTLLFCAFAWVLVNEVPATKHKHLYPKMILE